MNYEITLNGNEKYILLEIITKKNGKIINRQETDNEEKIKKALNILIPDIKTMHKLTNDTVRIPLSENAILTISNYSMMKDYDALSELRNCLKKISNDKKRKFGYAKILVLSTLATIALSTFQKEHEEDTLITAEAKPTIDYDLEEEITVLNTSDLVYASPSPKQIIYLEEEQVQEENKNQIVEKKEQEEFILRNIFPEISSKKEEARKQNVEKEYSALTEKYALITGIDQELLECILAQERGFHSSEKDKGGAIGVAQIQVSQHEGQKLYLRNELTGKKESFIVSHELLKNLEGNIKVCATILQNNLDYYNGNTLIALQSYNFGYGAMDKSLDIFSKNTGKTIDSILNDPTNIEWMESLKTYSDSRGGYGDPNYCKNVLNFYNEDTFTIKYNQNGENLKVPINNLENEKSHGL